jgi:uncharacterized membrane protein YgcG
MRRAFFLGRTPAKGEEVAPPTHSEPQHQPPSAIIDGEISPREPTGAAPPPFNDTIDHNDQRLFSACLQRDGWLRCLDGAAPWCCERSAALMRLLGGGRNPGERELLQVHRHGSLYTATLLSSSAHADVGEIVWQVDATERTMTTFGQPGYGATLLGEHPCVLLVEDRDGCAALYFYAGAVCQLRCWRRSPTSAERGSGRVRGKHPPHISPEAAAQQRKGARRPPSKERRHERRRSSSRGRGSSGSSGSSGGSRGGGGVRGGEGKGEGDGGDGEAAASASAAAAAALAEQRRSARRAERAATKRATVVSEWAGGRDLPQLLATLGDDCLRPLAIPGELLQLDEKELRAQSKALRKAYHKALLCCHPDKHVASPVQTQLLATAVFQALSASYAALAAGEAHREAGERYSC